MVVLGLAILRLGRRGARPAPVIALKKTFFVAMQQLTLRRRPFQRASAQTIAKRDQS
jgi:hypothetical protein